MEKLMFDETGELERVEIEIVRMARVSDVASREEKIDACIQILNRLVTEAGDIMDVVKTISDGEKHKQDIQDMLEYMKEDLEFMATDLEEINTWRKASYNI